MTDITVSAFTMSDVEAVNRIGREAYGAEPSQSALALAITGGGIGGALVARTAENEAVGFVLWDSYGGNNAYIANVNVSPQHQNRKIGRRLIEEAFVRMREQGYATASLVVSSSNEPALALYTKLGFEPYTAGCLVKAL